MNIRTLITARALVVLVALNPVWLPGQTSRLFGDINPPVTSSVPSDDLIIQTITVSKLPRKSFTVGRVGEAGQPTREALGVLFTAFQSQYSLDESDKIIPGAPWTGSSLASISTTIQQEANNGFLLLGTNPANAIVLKIDDLKPPAPETKFQTLAYKAGVQAWSDPQGVPQQSPLYQQVSLPLKEPTLHPPTRKQLIVALRSGQTFEVLVKEKDALVIQILEW